MKCTTQNAVGAGKRELGKVDPQQQSAAKRMSGGLGTVRDIDWPQDNRFGTTEVEQWRLGALRSMFCSRSGRSGGWPSVRWIVVVRTPLDLRPVARARLRSYCQRLAYPDILTESQPNKAAAGAELNSVEGVGWLAQQDTRILTWARSKETLEHTNIFLPSISSILLRSKYSARTIPAGHSFPPHSVSLV